MRTRTCDRCGAGGNETAWPATGTGTVRTRAQGAETLLDLCATCTKAVIEDIIAHDEIPGRVQEAGG